MKNIEEKQLEKDAQIFKALWDDIGKYKIYKAGEAEKTEEELNIYIIK